MVMATVEEEAIVVTLVAATSNTFKIFIALFGGFMCWERHCF